MLPITLYSHRVGPNPWKVALIMEELGIPYITEFVDFDAVKKPPFVLINPNGRLPAIRDPNTGISLWESGAIVEYLVDKYDTTHKITYPEFSDKQYLRQWLFFQVSGQAPYYGQAGWFLQYHPEKLQSVIDRYVSEMHRVHEVLESVLEKRDWLVGDKCTYADLSFLAWQRWAPKYGGEGIYSKFPNVVAWIKRMEERAAVQKVNKDWDAAISEVEAGKS